jgi:membrane fusion protein (multidrug efflux system)
VVGGDNTVGQRRIQVGQSTTNLAGIISGLQQGEHVVAEGLQKVRPGTKVVPGPASDQLQALMTKNDGEGESGQTGSGPGTSSSPPGDPPSGTAGKAPGNGTSSPKAQSGGR